MWWTIAYQKFNFSTNTRQQFLSSNANFLQKAKTSVYFPLMKQDSYENSSVQYVTRWSRKSGSVKPKHADHLCTYIYICIGCIWNGHSNVMWEVKNGKRRQYHIGKYRYKLTHDIVQGDSDFLLTRKVLWQVQPVVIKEGGFAWRW